MGDRLSQRDTTSTLSGSYFHIIIPDGGGGWLSYRISYTNLFSQVNTDLSGKMDISTYDPAGVSDDVFDCINTYYDNAISGLTSDNVQDAIDEVYASIGAAGVILIDTEFGKNSNFNKIYAANTKFYSINFRNISGTPTVKVGTSSGSDDLISDKVVNNGTDRNVTINVGFESSTTLYFTISGGTLNITIEYRQNYI